MGVRKVQERSFIGMELSTRKEYGAGRGSCPEENTIPMVRFGLKVYTGIIRVMARIIRSMETFMPEPENWYMKDYSKYIRLVWAGRLLSVRIPMEMLYWMRIQGISQRNQKIFIAIRNSFSEMEGNLWENIMIG